MQLLKLSGLTAFDKPVSAQHCHWHSLDVGTGTIKACISWVYATPPLQQAAANMARSSLEDFKIEGKLGSGSFGTVYQVTRKLDGRQYALKEIDLRCMSEQEQEDCIRECSVLAALDCPHIIKFYDSFLQKVLSPLSRPAASRAQEQQQ